MSLMVFDDSKIDKIKQRNQKGFQSNVDVVEASKEAKGGSELYMLVLRKGFRQMFGITFKLSSQELEN